MMSAVASLQHVMEPCVSINALFGSPIAVELPHIVQCPLMLAQFQNEKAMDSPLRYHVGFVLDGKVPEELYQYNRKQKTSSKLTKHEMQLGENVQNIELLRLVIEEGALGP